MIRHVVILKLKDDAPLEKIKKEILNLKNIIKEIKHIETGEDIKFDSSASDLCIIADFENIEDLKVYANHPEHLNVIKNYIKPYLIKRNAVDYYVY